MTLNETRMVTSDRSQSKCVQTKKDGTHLFSFKLKTDQMAVILRSKIPYLMKLAHGKASSNGVIGKFVPWLNSRVTTMMVGRTEPASRFSFHTMRRRSAAWLGRLSASNLYECADVMRHALLCSATLLQFEACGTHWSAFVPVVCFVVEHDMGDVLRTTVLSLCCKKKGWW